MRFWETSLRSSQRQTVSVEGRRTCAAGAARRRWERRRRCSSDLDRPRRSMQAPAGRRQTASAPGAPSAMPPSVSLKNRSSSVASSGVSARMPTPARPSASVSSPTCALLGLEADAVLARWRRARCRAARRASAQRARVVGRAQPVAGAALAAQVGERALVDDAPGVDDRDAVAQFLHLRELVAGEQHRDAFVGEAADQQAHVAHPGRIEAGRRLVEDQQARAAQQRGGDPEPLAHPVRVAADAMCSARGVSSTISSTSSMRAFAPSPSSAASSSRFLRRAQVGVEARRLDEARDALQRARALAHRVASEQLDRALASA